MAQANLLPKLDIAALHRLSQPPALYDPGKKLFWDDPYIAQVLLQTHLNPDTDAASRRPAFINASIDWLLASLAPEPGAAWLDLGCGPGLYTSRLARRGLSVTGVDFSRSSIAYARDIAAQQNLPVTYRCEDYLKLTDDTAYNIVSLIYGDFCPLFPAERAELLARVHRALKPGGRFVFDVSAPLHHIRHSRAASWYAAPEGGLWRPGPHLVLENNFPYPGDIYLDQYVVIEPEGASSVYRFWFQDYTPDRITTELAEAGFRVTDIWGDLTGTPYTPDSEWLGVVAQRI
jgi:SAM-dependent methyltransferase